MQINWIRNGERAIWIAYNGETGRTLGEVRKHNAGFQVYVDGPRGDIAQGAPHATLATAQSDLASFYR